MSAVDVQEMVEREYPNGGVWEVEDSEDGSWTLMGEHEIGDFFPTDYASDGSRIAAGDDETDADVILGLETGEFHVIGGGAAPIFTFYRIR